MQQGTNYEIEGLLKAGKLNITQGIDKNMQPVYILLQNLIGSQKKDDLSMKFDSYLRSFRPFKPFVLIVCSQEGDNLKPDDVKNILKIATKKVDVKQLQRIARLIIVSQSLQGCKLDKLVPDKLKDFVKDKFEIIQKYKFTQISAGLLSDYDIELHQSTLKFICNKIQYQEEQSFYGRELTSYPIAQSGIPVFMEEILKYYAQNDDYLKTQGVFRISGSHEQEQQLVEQFRQHNYMAIRDYTPDVISTVLKNALVNLKSPIFPFEIYDILKDVKPSITVEEFVEMFRVFFAHMPSVNRVTIQRLAELLKHVASYESTNLVSCCIMQMGLHNLSIVFAPCFFRPEMSNSIDLHGAKVVVEHFQRLIMFVDHFMPKKN